MHVHVHCKHTHTHKDRVPSPRTPRSRPRSVPPRRIISPPAPVSFSFSVLFECRSPIACLPRGLSFPRSVLPTWLVLFFAKKRFSRRRQNSLRKENPYLSSWFVAHSTTARNNKPKTKKNQNNKPVLRDKDETHDGSKKIALSVSFQKKTYFCCCVGRFFLFFLRARSYFSSCVLLVVAVLQDDVGCAFISKERPLSSSRLSPCHCDCDFLESVDGAARSVKYKIRKTTKKPNSPREECTRGLHHTVRSVVAFSRDVVIRGAKARFLWDVMNPARLDFRSVICAHRRATCNQFGDKSRNTKTKTENSRAVG